MKVSVFGTGYVGLVTAACLAEIGNDVLGMDIDQKKVESLNQGVTPIYEKGLEEILVKNLKEKRLKFTLSHAEAVQHGEVLFITVGTPQKESGAADIKYVEALALKIGQNLDSYKVVVNKSTVPIGASVWVKNWIEKAEKKSASIPFDVVSNPEFLQEGTAVKNFLEPDRIILGTDSKKAEQILKELYSPFVQKGCPLLVMDSVSSEITKYASNSFLATKISFINEIANYCERVGGNIDFVKKGMSLDKRIGEHFLNAGVGYGGSCFPKDVEAMIHFGQSENTPFQILTAVRSVNAKQKKILLQKLKHQFSSLQSLKIAIWGLAFKPFTDDVREAPALELIQSLKKEGAKIFAHDPVALKNAKIMLGEAVHYVEDQYAVLKNADALLILTEWPEYGQADFKKIKKNLNQPHVFDGRNLFPPSVGKDFGLYYHSIGRQTEKPNL